jgi:hypothetical protein
MIGSTPIIESVLTLQFEESGRRPRGNGMATETLISGFFDENVSIFDGPIRQKKLTCKWPILQGLAKNVGKQKSKKPARQRG